MKKPSAWKRIRKLAEDFTLPVDEEVMILLRLREESGDVSYKLLSYDAKSEEFFDPYLECPVDPGVKDPKIDYICLDQLK